MAVNIAGVGRVLVSVIGAGLKGEPGSSPGGYVKDIVLMPSGRYEVRDADDNPMGHISGIRAEPGDDGTLALFITNEDGTTFQAVITGGDDVVYLNNPVIYVNSVTGTPNPVIESQDDLTAGNAFDSFNSVRSFMNRSIIVGSVTLDCRGVFQHPGNFGPAQFKNAQYIKLRGDPADASAFEFHVGRSDGTAYGINCTGGTVEVRDFTARWFNESEQPGTAAAGIINDSSVNGTILFGGKVSMLGNFRTDRADATGAMLMKAFAGVVGLMLDTTITINMASTSRLSQLISCNGGSRFTLNGNLEINIQSEIELAQSVIDMQSGSTLSSIITAPGIAAPNITGPARVISPYTIKAAPLASVQLTGDTWGSRTAKLERDWGADLTSGGVQAEMYVHQIATLDNLVGTDT